MSEFLSNMLCPRLLWLDEPNKQIRRIVRLPHAVNFSCRGEHVEWPEVIYWVCKISFVGRPLCCGFYIVVWDFIVCSSKVIVFVKVKTCLVISLQKTVFHCFSHIHHLKSPTTDDSFFGHTVMVSLRAKWSFQALCIPVWRMIYWRCDRLNWLLGFQGCGHPFDREGSDGGPSRWEGSLWDWLRHHFHKSSGPI